jgi:DNA-binding CsgD family transcriptional regulator
MGRPVTWPLAAQDETILRLKEEGHTFQQIAQHLKDRGMADYKAVSISSRLKSIRKKQASHAAASAQQTQVSSGQHAYRIRLTFAQGKGGVVAPSMD